jgi:hypothetical protein
VRDCTARHHPAASTTSTQAASSKKKAAGSLDCLIGFSLRWDTYSCLVGDELRVAPWPAVLFCTSSVCNPKAVSCFSFTAFSCFFLSPAYLAF